MHDARVTSLTSRGGHADSDRVSWAAIRLSKDQSETIGTGESLFGARMACHVHWEIFFGSTPTSTFHRGFPLSARRISAHLGETGKSADKSCGSQTLSLLCERSLPDLRQSHTWLHSHLRSAADLERQTGAVCALTALRSALEAGSWTMD